MTRKIILALAAICLFSGHAVRAAASISASTSAAASAPYGGIFDGVAGLRTAPSLFATLRRAGNKVWLELPVRYLGREMLVASTLTDISDGRYGEVGFKQQKPLHVRFTRADSTLHLRLVNSGSTTNFAAEALARTTLDPILAAFPIVARGAGDASVVVELGDFLLDNPSYFDFFDDDGKWSSTLNRDACSHDAVKAFEDNFSILSTLSFTVSGGGARGGVPATARVTRSFLLLPEERMTPRLADSRVGVFVTDKVGYASPLGGSRAYSLANRWRVVPSDAEAYARGETVRPTRQIVWYIDPAFPAGWHGTIKRAVERWNEAFEAIGFRDVLCARPFPTPAEDAEFDPDNLKYSCIRFLPSPTVNAMGPSWVDPATGEIINATVIVWSDVVKLFGAWRFVQTAQVDPAVRRREPPEAVMLDAVEYAIAHEVGHTLGFAHNMASSNAWRVDSLRSPGFTRRYGTTPSIMDYARFNYIAQPGDAGVALTPPRLGVYDYFLVKWAYRYVPGARNEREEAAEVESWVDAVAGDPVYRYGRQQLAARYDPTAIEEDLGDDPLRAGDYGVANLRYILPRLDGWIEGDGDRLHRKFLYEQICEQYGRYIAAATLCVGGIRLTEVKEGIPGRHIAPVARDTQRAAVRWVMGHYRDMEWIDEPSLTRHFPLSVAASAQLREKVLDALKERMDAVVLSSHHAQQAGEAAYTTADFAADLYREAWRATLRRGTLTEGERALQRSVVKMFCAPLASMGKGDDDDEGTPLSEIPIVARGDGFGPAGMGFQMEVDIAAIDDSEAHLVEMALRSRELVKRAARRRGPDRAHYLTLLATLNAALKDKLLMHAN